MRAKLTNELAYASKMDNACDAKTVARASLILMKRWGPLVLFLAVNTVFTLAAGAQSRFGIAAGTDRFGADYEAFQVSDAPECAAKCARDANCAAFTFLNPTVAGQLSSCWLKQPPPGPSDNPCCTSGARGAVADISIVSANMFGVAPIDGGDGSDWRQRHDRLALEIFKSGPPPDMISITEIYGWSWCLFPASETAGDYDTLDAVIDGLARRTGIQYRVAYMVGRQGGSGGIGNSRCQHFFGDAVLYNPVSFIRPGKPNENAYIESFNGKFLTNA